MANYQLSEPAFLTMDHAMILSDLRKSARVDVRDWVGAMYAANLDRVSRYWNDPNGLERLVMSDPGTEANVRDLRSCYPTSILEHRGRVGGAFKPFTSEFKDVWFRAIDIARSANKEKEKVSVFPEHFLLAIAEQADLEIARRLLASGLQVEVLRRDVEKGISQ